ncbi:MAG: GNAT family N-acetyltransferase [Muricomes sp.]
MGDIILRKATIEDMDDIMQLQIDIFHGEQRIPSEDISRFAEKSPQCWCALLDGKIVGAAAAWEEGGQVHWGRFVINPNFRGLHIGTKLAEFSLKDLFSQQITEVYMEAREVTAKIVSKMGGKIVGEPVSFYEGTVTPIILHKSDFMKAILKSVQK